MARRSWVQELCSRKSTWDWGRALVVGRRGRGAREHMGAQLADPLHSWAKVQASQGSKSETLKTLHSVMQMIKSKMNQEYKKQILRFYSQRERRPAQRLRMGESSKSRRGHLSQGVTEAGRSSRSSLCHPL